MADAIEGWSGRLSMTRRSFFGLLAAAFTLDPKRLLWTPGRKFISIPKPVKRAWRARTNQIVTGDMILDAAMECYARESAIMQLSNANCWAKSKIGDTIAFRPRSTITSGVVRFAA